LYVFAAAACIAEALLGDFNSQLSAGPCSGVTGSQHELPSLTFEENSPVLAALTIVRGSKLNEFKEPVGL